MKAIHQRNISLLLLIALFLQSCGVDVPRALENKQVFGEELAPPATVYEAQATEVDSKLTNGTKALTIPVSPMPLVNTTATRQLSDEDLLHYIQESSIQFTSELVDTLNHTSHPAERLALCKWVRGYIQWFRDQTAEHLDTERYREYAHLAHIEPRSGADHALLHRYFGSLAEKIESSKPVDRHLIQALDNTLQHIGLETFQERIDELNQIGSILLKQIKPRHITLSEENYPQHEAMLKALYNILLVMYKLDSSSWAEADGLYAAFQEKMAAIQGASKYYPYSYHAQLLSQSLEILAGCNVHDTAQQVWEACKAWGCALQMFDRLIEAEEGTAEQVIQRYIQLKNDIVHLRVGPAESTWFKRLIDITVTSMEVLEDQQQWSTFVQKVQALEDDSIFQDAYAESCRVLRYGIIKQLAVLALHSQRAAESLEILKESAELAIKDRDQHVIELVFEGVSAVAKQEQTGSQSEEAAGMARSYLLSLQEDGDEPAAQLSEPTSKRPRLDIGASSKRTLGTATDLSPSALTKAMRKWLKCTSLEQKLDPVKPCETTPMQDFIFKAVKAAWIAGTCVGRSLQRPRGSTFSEAEIQDSLKAYYQQPHFKQVTLLAGEAFMSLEDVKCNLKLNEKIKVQ